MPVKSLPLTTAPQGAGAPRSPESKGNYAFIVL